MSTYISYINMYIVDEKMAEGTKAACVTGGNGYLASILIKQLLHKGYAVNATVRHPGT